LVALRALLRAPLTAACLRGRLSLSFLVVNPKCLSEILKWSTQDRHSVKTPPLFSKQRFSFSTISIFLRKIDKILLIDDFLLEKENPFPYL